MASLKGKVCMVTGASSGIGAATAIHFASLGAKLAITGRDLHSLEKTKKKCTEEGLAEDEVFISVGDLAVDADLDRVFHECISQYSGTLHVLVNSAGIVVPGSLLNTTMEMYDRQMNINTRSIFHMTQLASPFLIKVKGTIVNVSSVTGLRSFPGVSAYCMSKAAVDQFTRCTALDLASCGVRCNAVNPGVIMTDIHKRGGMDDETYAAFLEKSKTTHALGRIGQRDEVAKAIAFLASDDSSFITGATLPIDGGRHAMCPR
ncbi:PREDICTED: 3-oxoacyl-[acyl-carrier-protein] reductase FabG-like isoform X2 [Priapulus caudatus]|uniref:3-oxoacyl-[acyl-carrier-protein] reductase FabG-like isoform X2 n=1 Tax=Priapulus caudatus TaxID=37621 RepID=A0ABM1F1Y3_PRICU|nr:PREDICTED: 3-oxoacyl-[acyl-carrier-protein] reductase FabG-like isoform X2 [Priapulus caudatus]